MQVQNISIPSSPKFPGSRALTPVLGALLVIAAGHEAFINKRILSSKLFIFFGLISYPLYLWHWPLLSLAYICNGQIPDAYIRAICVVLAIFLSILTFYFIEPPLRYGKAPKLKAISLFVVLLGLGGGLAIIYILMMATALDIQKLLFWIKKIKKFGKLKVMITKSANLFSLIG